MSDGTNAAIPANLRDLRDDLKLARTAEAKATLKQRRNETMEALEAFLAAFDEDAAGCPLFDGGRDDGEEA